MLKSPRLGGMSLWAVVALVGFSFTTAAHAAPPLELDNWDVPFAPNNPFTCNAAGCVSQTSSQVSMPGVNRVATLRQENAGTGSVPGTSVGSIAGVKDGGATVKIDNGGTKYLSFQTGENVFASLDLTYGFAERYVNRIELNIANKTSHPFSVALFTLNDDDPMNLKFDFQTDYKVAAAQVDEELLKFPGTVSTSELLIIYNPLASSGMSFSFQAGGNIPWMAPTFDDDGRASDLHLELCCVASQVPEPDTWAMLLFGFFGIGLFARKARTSLPAAI